MLRQEVYIGLEGLRRFWCDGLEVIRENLHLRQRRVLSLEVVDQALNLIPDSSLFIKGHVIIPLKKSSLLDLQKIRPSPDPTIY